MNHLDFTQRFGLFHYSMSRHIIYQSDPIEDFDTALKQFNEYHSNRPGIVELQETTREGDPFVLLETRMLWKDRI